MTLQTYPDLRSMETIASLLTDAEIDELLAELDIALLNWSWDYTGRVDQIAATDDISRIVGFVGGRGTGKTRTGGEWIRRRVGKGYKYRFGLVGRTAGDVRDTMIRGPGGILSVFPPSEAPVYTPANRRIDFVDGSEALCFSSQEPDQIRGPNFHFSWADELATWDMRPDDSGLNAWDNLNFSTRLDDPLELYPRPQILFTTTPKRIKMLREILEEAKDSKRISIYNQGTTHDNIHLARDFIEDIVGLHGGTRLEEQEILGILSDEVEGALWSEELIARNRTYSDPGTLPIRRVGVDPTTADNPHDECGIVVVGATPKGGPVLKRTGYVLADRSGHMSPKKWAKAAVEAAKEYDAPIVAEDNQGGAMVREVIHGIDETIRVELVTSTVSKKMRADPVAYATDQGRIKFFRRFPELEDQMVTWVPEEMRKDESPDRVDAMVHGFTGIVTHAKKKRGGGGRVRTSGAARRRSLGMHGLRRPA